MDRKECRPKFEEDKPRTLRRVRTIPHKPKAGASEGSDDTAPIWPEENSARQR